MENDVGGRINSVCFKGGKFIRNNTTISLPTVFTDMCATFINVTLPLYNKAIAYNMVIFSEYGGYAGAWQLVNYVNYLCAKSGKPIPEEIVNGIALKIEQIEVCLINELLYKHDTTVSNAFLIVKQLFETLNLLNFNKKELYYWNYIFSFWIKARGDWCAKMGFWQYLEYTSAINLTLKNLLYFISIVLDFQNLELILEKSLKEKKRVSYFKNAYVQFANTNESQLSIIYKCVSKLYISTLNSNQINIKNKKLNIPNIYQKKINEIIFEVSTNYVKNIVENTNGICKNWNKFKKYLQNENILPILLIIQLHQKKLTEKDKIVKLKSKEIKKCKIRMFNKLRELFDLKQFSISLYINIKYNHILLCFFFFFFLIFLKKKKSNCNSSPLWME